MNILYLSVLASKPCLDSANKYNPHFSGHAVHKFNRLIVEGFAANGENVCSLSTFYLPNQGWFWHRKKELINGVEYKYIPCINAPLFRHVLIVWYCFVYVLFWGLYNRKNKVLICDVLNISACIGSIAAARIINLRRVGIMTDMPGLMVNRGSKNPPKYLRSSGVKYNKRYLNKFTHYVFLTERMNEVNTRNRPYIIMEGLVNPQVQLSHSIKNVPRTILYAGGLHARYGLRMLIDAVKSLHHTDIQLILYGDGPIVSELQSETDPRIVYRGLAPNDVIVEEERRATILVNPRPTHESFTNYSFPSKNMEYMVSGTPLITTRLPGMPQEYYPYVFLFDEETTEGYAKKLDEILNLSSEELQRKGESAREFVLANKANTIQTKRILNLLNM